MSATLEGSFSLPKPVLGYHPGTFLERGASVPFTTPHLNGARARPGPRGGLEFTVPNPSGGRGMYIVPWEGVFALCRPTMHDSRLISVLSAMRGVTPTAIRHAARSIAAEGLAGRAARAAAEAAMAVDERSRMTANFQLLLDLVAQVEARADAGPTADLVRRARRAVAAIAPALGQSTEAVATALEELAQLFANIGVGRISADSRVPRIVSTLGTLRDAMQEWSRAHPDESGGDAARIAESAEVTLACLRVVMGEAHALLRDMRALLRAWFADPDALSALVTRPDWLVDGWERIILLWQTAEALGPGATLTEMASLIPGMPKEVAEWCRVPVPGLSEGTSRRRMVAMMEDWRTGITLYDMIARNEQILAMTQ
jgi:hypothetical protein